MFEVKVPLTVALSLIASIDPGFESVTNPVPFDAKLKLIFVSSPVAETLGAEPVAWF